MFNTTIGFNIAFGACSDGPVSQQQIEEAAKEAQIYDFIMRSPKKFETMVGERGLRLSGGEKKSKICFLVVVVQFWSFAKGEKQRVAIARMLLKNPTFLVLDEATASLDSYTEKLIVEALNEIQKNRTSFVIAHRFVSVETNFRFVHICARLSTVMGADKIVVLDQGRVVEQGSHQELLGKTETTNKRVFFFSPEMFRFVKPRTDIMPNFGWLR